MGADAIGYEVPMTEISEEPPDDNEAFESLDEALDDEDAQSGFTRGPQGQRDLDSELVVDEYELEEAGALLDDPDRISLIDGSMDDPDGAPPRTRRPPALYDGWERDPLEAEDAGLEDSDDEDEDDDDISGETSDDPELQISSVDPADLEQVPDDAAGEDSARW